MSGFCVGCDLGALQVGIHRSHKGHRKRSKPLSLQTVQTHVVKEPFTWKSKSLQSVKCSIFSVLGRMPLPVSWIPPVPSALGLLDSIAGKIKSHFKSSIQCLTQKKHFGWRGWMEEDSLKQKLLRPTVSDMAVTLTSQESSLLLQ